MLRIGGHCWADQKAGKLAEEARKIRNGCGNATAVETELLEWTMNEGQKEALLPFEAVLSAPYSRCGRTNAL